MQQTSEIPRRLDKEWRRKYDAEYREKTKEHRKQQTKEYRSKPSVRKRISRASKEWYDEHRDEVMLRHRQRDSTIEGKIKRWKEGAKRRGIEWHLTVDFILRMPRVCYYSGLPLVLETGHSNTLSLDRVDSNKSYTEDNVRPCCAMINVMKQDFSDVDFVEMCRKIVSHKDRRTVFCANDSIHGS